MAEIEEPITGTPFDEMKKVPKPLLAQPLVLLVDDDRGLSALMKRYLNREGFEVENLYSGHDVLEWLTKRRPDLLVIDYLMPDMNGKDLIQELKARDIDIPFITVTGQGDERLAVEMVKLGAMDYLVKDQVMLDMLPSVVRNSLHQIEQARRLEESEKGRQVSESRYRGIFNASMEPILILDLKGLLIDANPRACEMTGFTVDELCQKRFSEILAEDESGFWNKLALGSI